MLYKIMASISMCFHYFTQGWFLKLNLTFQTALIATYPRTLVHSLTSLSSGDPAVLPWIHDDWALMISTTISTVSPRNITDILTQAALTGRFQASTPNQESINIWLLGQITAVLLGDTSTVKDTSSLCSFRRDSRHEPLTNFGMHFLSLFGSGDFAGSNSPRLFISVFFRRFTQALPITA